MKKLITLSLMLAAQVAANAQTTKLQVIHNCADAIADSVDVYLGSTKLLDNFAFRTATPFIDAPTGIPLTLGVAPKTSTSVMDTIYSVTVTLDAAKKYVLVANGLVSPTGYSPAASAVPFRLSVYDMARLTAATAGNTDILVAHGSTDAPTVDVKAGSTTLVDNISFGNFCSTGYLSVPVANYTLDVTDMSGATIVKRYSAPLSTLNLGDSAITVVASGFLDSTMNSNGKPFGLWVALPQGGNLIPLPSLALPTAVSSINANSNISIFPNPAGDYINVVSSEPIAKISVMDVAGRILSEQSANTQEKTNISQLAPGVYIVKVVTESGAVSTQKITKK